MAKVTTKRYAQALYELTLDQDKSTIQKIIAAFVDHLAKTRQLSRAGQIVAALEKYANDQENIVTAVVTTARPINAQLLTDISDLIAKFSSAKTVEISTIQDDDLLGGFTVAAQDWRLDASLQQQLQNLNKALNS